MRDFINYYRNMDSDIRGCITINLLIVSIILSTFLPWFRYIKYVKYLRNYYRLRLR